MATNVAVESAERGAPPPQDGPVKGAGAGT